MWPMHVQLVAYLAPDNLLQMTSSKIDTVLLFDIQFPFTRKELDHVVGNDEV